MPVHMLGNPCDMDPIMEIAKKHNLYVIEDCCQAVGAAYHGKRVGTIGDMGAYSLNVFKTITTGDGGFVGTSSDELYERAFGFHDQGHKPCRMGVEVGNRSMVGMNMRMNELSGAVAVAQGRKLDGILDTLRAKKKELKDQLQGIDGLGFRKINDEKECATLLTLLFDTKELADKFCAVMGTAPIAKSGWHVYNNMEQILDKKTWTDNHPFHLSDRTYESICSRRRTISWTARSISPSASWIRAWAPAAASTSTRPKRRDQRHRQAHPRGHRGPVRKAGGHPNETNQDRRRRLRLDQRYLHDEPHEREVHGHGARRVQRPDGGTYERQRREVRDQGHEP